MHNQTPTATLTRRQCEVMAARARGLTIKEVASELCLSSHTIRHHIESIHLKLNVHCLQQALLRLQVLGR